jgi:hypothetical protein
VRAVKVQTREVTREKGSEGSEPLEPIDLKSESRTPTRASRQQWTSSRSRWAAVAVVVASVAALCVALAVGSRRGGPHAVRPLTSTSAPAATIPQPTQPAAPTSRPHGPIPGRFYPVLDQTDTTTLVLLSGLNVTLSGGLTKTIGGLGVVFGGSVSPKDSTVCCPLNFEVDHGAPIDLFNTLGPHAVTTPVLVSAAQAKQDDLKQGVGPYAILSTGDWTLVETNSADPAVLKRLNAWRLRSTPYGAVLEVPADSTIDYSGAFLGRTPDLSNRQVELTENSCAANADAKRTITPYDSGEAVGYWCVNGLRVRIEGPRSYVESVVADLKVNVTPNT